MTSEIWGMTLQVPNTFGDNGREWIEGRAIVWNALQMNAKIVPPTRFEHGAPNYGWWIGLVDLLAFAGGVDDIAAYLRSWAASGYTASTRLQEFIRSNWGDSVAALEVFLYLHPNAREQIYRYVQECKGAPIEGEKELPSGDELIRLNAAAYSTAILRSERDPELVKGLFSGLNYVDVDYLASARPQWGDPAHLGAHFTFEWSEHSGVLQDGETVEFGKYGSARLSLGTYSGWYAKLHTLRREFERDPDTARDFDRVEVDIAGLGSLGVFVFDLNRQCFVLEGEEKASTEISSSPRYGFELSPQMTSALLPRLAAYHERKSEVIEQVELQIREDVDLAHSLTYEIGPGDEDSMDWTRIDGEWQEGFMIPQGVHHKRCTKALIDANKLDHTMPWHQAVLSDTTVYDVSPWAFDLVRILWDMGHPIQSFIGQLAGMEEEEDVSISVGGDHDELHHQLSAYVAELPNFIKADESFLVQDLLDWQEGRKMSAKELLAAVVDAESHR